MAIAALAKQQAEPYLLITPDTATAYQIQQELNFFAEELVVKLLPDWETLPYDNFSPHEDIISERLRTLSELPAMSSGILVAPIATLMQKIAPPDYIQANSLQLKVGQILDLAEIRRQLESAAYQNVSTVYQHGEYALRGSILDIFPMGSEQPYRIDLLDNEIDSLRSFDPDSQRSLESCQVIDLLPGREFPLDENGITQFRRNWHERFEVDHRQCTLYQDVSDGLAPAGIEYYLKLFFDDTATLFDYLPARSVCIMLEGIEEAANHHWQDIKQRHEQRCGDIRRPVLAPQEIFQTVAELFSELKNYPRIAIQQSALDDCGSHGQNFPFSTPPMLNIESKDSDPIKALRDYAQGKRLLICSESLGRREALIELLSRHQLRPHEVNSWADYAQQDHALAITVGPLDDGINLLQPQAFAIISEAQLFGKRVSQNRRRKKAVSNADQVIKNLAELRIGAPVVHSDHGVGRYLGLQTLEIDGEANEFLHLEYADEAKLYVPVGSLQLISRYSGADDERAPLHRLGSEQWSKAKRKAAERIRDVAAELLDIYARREARGGRAFKATADDYLQFSNAFPFEETPDQEQAIDAVVADLQSEKSMDRLVCGDVGFGKTEVAVRAAFVAIQGGSQVALLVPTTLLAQQHFESFRDRFADWPVNIEVLSRFRSASEQTAIIRDVAAGKVDI
ncbi:MAG: CarD family transcriptional regulator, partial [Spongiibacteraceae bacterium]